MIQRLITLCVALPSLALAEESDPVVEAIRRFHESHGPGKANEVTVVLDPPSHAPQEKPSAPPTEAPAPPPVTPAPSPEPVAAGKAPEPPAATTDLPRGIEVEVRGVGGARQPADSSQPRILAPFPAKPLSQAPAGWRIEHTSDVPPFEQDVDLGQGRVVKLSIQPHVLVPDVDGSTSFAIAEPGFDPSLGYRQNATVGAVLSRSMRQLDEDSKQMGVVLDQLQQLLISMPKGESKPPAAKPITTQAPQDTPPP